MVLIKLRDYYHGGGRYVKIDVSKKLNVKDLQREKRNMYMSLIRIPCKDESVYDYYYPTTLVVVEQIKRAIEKAIQTPKYKMQKDIKAIDKRLEILECHVTAIMEALTMEK